MVTVSSFWFMILIELLIATTLVSVLLIVLNIVRKSRDRKAAANIILKIKEDEKRRTAETKKIMIHKFGFDDGDAEKLAVKMDHEERAFYQKIINMYLLRDGSALEALNITFEAAVDPYRTLQPPGGGTSANAADESKDMAHLKKENKRLSEEIAVTMQTMGRMLSEYSTMFAEKAKEQEESAQEEEVVEEQPEPAAADTAEQDDGMDEMAAADAEEESEEEEEAAKDVDHQKPSMVEDMDDLSDLDPKEDKDLKDLEAPENPDELIG